MKHFAPLAVCTLSCFVASAQGRFNYPPDLPDAKVEVYKTVGEAKLNLYIFDPTGGRSGSHRAAIVFFFGGGWRNGSPAQFAMQCRRLASLGMVAITADYRVSSRQHATALDGVRDAKSVIRYVRENAARLGVDPERIAAGGGSAGGHLAAAAGIIGGLDEPGENQAVSSRPDALVLFNPAVLLAAAPDDVELTRIAWPISLLNEFKGVDAESISPWHHVARNDPATIIFHGKADTTVPYVTVESFTTKMKAAGNRCELVGFEGQNHGFFNYNPSGNPYYDATLRGAEQFLARLGYLTTANGSK